MKRWSAVVFLQLAMPKIYARSNDVQILRCISLAVAGTFFAIAMAVGAPAENEHHYVEGAQESASDLAISRHIVDSLHSDLQAESKDVLVRTRDAHAHLYGIVDSQADKIRASEIASQAPGAVHVGNHLSVSREWRPKSDDQIRKDLQDKLVWTFATNAERIDVTVEEGVAILNGQVHTWMEWQKAMDLAIEAGARRPHNLLEVHRDPRLESPTIYVPQK